VPNACALSRFGPQFFCSGLADRYTGAIRGHLPAGALQLGKSPDVDMHPLQRSMTLSPNRLTFLADALRQRWCLKLTTWRGDACGTIKFNPLPLIELWRFMYPVRYASKSSGSPDPDNGIRET
jgi:hypothetical protein